MPRYVALLRGVSPVNARMADLRKCFEEAGFTDVKTLLSSGNVAFTAKSATEASLERKAEAAMQARLGRTFDTIVRSSARLQALVENDPFAGIRVPTDAKKIVTFFRTPPPAGLVLPAELDGAKIHRVAGKEAFSTYRPNPRGPVFMTLLEKTFGKMITTRTFETVRKCAKA